MLIPAFFIIPRYPVAEIVGFETGAVAGEKKGAHGGQVSEQGASLGQISSQPSRGSGSDWKQAAFTTLAFTDQEGLKSGVKVSYIQIRHFGTSDSCRVEEFENRPVPQPERALQIWQGEEALKFIGIQGLRQATVLLSREIQISRRIGRNDAFPAHPGEEASDGTEPGKLGVDPEWLPGAR